MVKKGRDGTLCSQLGRVVVKNTYDGTVLPVIWLADGQKMPRRDALTRGRDAFWSNLPARVRRRQTWAALSVPSRVNSTMDTANNRRGRTLEAIFDHVRPKLRACLRMRTPLAPVCARTGAQPCPPRTAPAPEPARARTRTGACPWPHRSLQNLRCTKHRPRKFSSKVK